MPVLPGFPAGVNPALDYDRAAGVPSQVNGREPLIAVCMATYEPRLDLFEAQIESLRRQTYARWTCVVSDDRTSPVAAHDLARCLDGDSRFSLSTVPRRLGFYRNFERSLGLIPPDASYVAFCDQDDVWHSNKLETLAGRLADESVMLAYGDMRVVSDRGHIVSETYWTTRPTAAGDLASLLITNTIPGASALFSASLLPVALPFPPPVGDAYHDHWLACCALALGRIAYEARPLVDYVVHGDNVLGHAEPNSDRLARQVAGLVHALVSDDARRRIAERLIEIHRDDVRRVRLMARTLERRCGTMLPRPKARAVERIGRIEDSWLVLAWLLLRGLRNVPRLGETVGAEYALAAAAAWNRLGRG